MARRFNKSDALEPDERPVARPVSLARLVRAQPGQKKSTTRNFRPIRMSDFGDDENNREADESDQDIQSPFGGGLDHKFHFEPTESTAASQRPTRIQPGTEMTSSSQVRDKAAIQSIPAVLPTGPMEANSEKISPKDLGSTLIDDYAKLFGKALPDAIQLSVVIGESNGQVMLALVEFSVCVLKLWEQ